MHRVRIASSLGRASLIQHQRAPFALLASCSSPSVPVTSYSGFPSLRAPFSSNVTLQAEVRATQSSTRTTSTPAPEMSSSLDHLLPKSLFEQQIPPLEDVINIQESRARQIVEVILTQLRIGIDASSKDEIDALQLKADEDVLKILQNASIPASSLHHLVTQMLRISKDPRRTPIAFRLFGIAFGVNPLQLEDPTSKTAAKVGPDSTLASTLIAGKDAWGINAAGYSWASMVLSGQSPPPPGLHLLTRGSKEYVAAISGQQAAAVRVYATLAMRGDAQGMLGMGRVLMAGTQREVPIPGKSGQESDQEVRLMRERTIALWTKAGQMGIGDAWFELGLLYLGNIKGIKADEAESRRYFELGAEKGNFRCHHALGVIHTRAAMADNQSPSSEERKGNLAKSLRHFTSAAEMGDPQSAHNLGLRYLLRDEMIEEIAIGSDKDGRTNEQILEQTRNRHANLWGVQADDVIARQWFARAAEAGSVPAMMNYAGMLVEARGRSLSSDDSKGEGEEGYTLIQMRLRDLRKAESLYSKVAAHGSVLAQQQSQTAPSETNAGVDQASGPKEVNMGKEMADFAQEALGTVQEMIKAIVEGAEKMHGEAATTKAK